VNGLYRAARDFSVVAVYPEKDEVATVRAWIEDQFILGHLRCPYANQFLDSVKELPGGEFGFLIFAQGLQEGIGEYRMS
jgi:hypothetical protein